MTQGELYKKLSPMFDGYFDDRYEFADVLKVLDEAKKDFYKIINEEVPEDQNDPESLYELMKNAVEKWFGGYEK
jgi:hypothetical protein